DTLTGISERRQMDSRKLSQTIRGDLDWIVMKALEKDRNRRYETASALSGDVERFLSDQPVEACPPSQIYRVSKAIRRNKAIITAAGLILLALLGGTAVSTWQAIRARHARYEMA